MWQGGSLRLREELNLPNFLTVLNALAGFLSTILILEGDTKTSLKLILLAAILDALDGRIARIFNTTGEFGKELDSLADIVSFGVAPSLLIYRSRLIVSGYLGTFVASSLVIAGVIRLARFNIVRIGEYFIGLPIPAVGCFFALYLMSNMEMPAHMFTAIVIALSLLMVSNLKYPNFKARHDLLIQGTTLGTCSIIFLMIMAATTSHHTFKILALAPFVAYITLGPLIHRAFRKIDQGTG